MNLEDKPDISTLEMLHILKHARISLAQTLKKQQDYAWRATAYGTEFAVEHPSFFHFDIDRNQRDKHPDEQMNQTYALGEKCEWLVRVMEEAEMKNSAEGLREFFKSQGLF